jgi:hypothetical protein
MNKEIANKIVNVPKCIKIENDIHIYIYIYRSTILKNSMKLTIEIN